MPMALGSAGDKEFIRIFSTNSFFLYRKPTFLKEQKFSRLQFIYTSISKIFHKFNFKLMNNFFTITVFEKH